MANVGKRITKAVVDAMKPGDLAWDSEIKGFGCRCQKRGKFYVLKYRLDGRQRWLTIGQHGSPWTPQEARDEALKRLGDVKEKKDPAAQRDREKVAPTVKVLAKRFMTEHVEAKRKDRTNDEYKRLIDKMIVPHIGSYKVADIKRADIAKLHHSLSATPYQANRVLAVLSKMFNLAEVWGERPDGSNPCRHVERFKEERHERFLSGEELGRLGTALAHAEADYKAHRPADDKKPIRGAAKGKSRTIDADRADLISPEAIGAIRLLVFTGARLNEILTLQWDWIDFERGVARLPVSKTGAKTLHLPAPALEVLSGFKKIEGNPYVLVGQKAKMHLSNLAKPWMIIRKRAGLDDVRLHDLRHSFASTAAASGMGLPIIGKMLGHTQAQTTMRYAHLGMDPVKDAAAKVSSQISAAMNVYSMTA